MYDVGGQDHSFTQRAWDWEHLLGSSGVLLMFSLFIWALATRQGIFLHVYFTSFKEKNLRVFDRPDSSFHR